MDISTLSRQANSRSIVPLIAALWATGVALFLLFAPTYDRSVAIYGPNTSAFEVARNEAMGHASALEVNGPHTLVALTIPILLHRRAALLAAGALTLGFCILGGLLIGVFYLPTALLLLLAGARTRAETGHAI